MARAAHDEQVRGLAERIGAVVVLSPGSTGVLPDAHPQNMHVGGSKGSISGNYAMEEAELLIAMGYARGVPGRLLRASAIRSARGGHQHQWRSRSDVLHYNRTPGAARRYRRGAQSVLQSDGRARGLRDRAPQSRHGSSACAGEESRHGRAFKQQRYDADALFDAVWKQPVLTQPQAIKTVADFAKSVDALKLFDAGDVQANGFQIVEDDRPVRHLSPRPARPIWASPVSR